MRGRPRPRPPAVCFIGPSGSGKTTLITKLVGEFKRRGLRVGAIKHSRAGFSLDLKGKDSARFRDAGAACVMLLSRAMLGIIAARPRAFSPPSALRLFPPGTDIVLVEGWKGSGLPAVLLSSGARRARTRGGVVAEVGKRGTLPGVPLFSPSSISAIADFLLSLSPRP